MLGPRPHRPAATGVDGLQRIASPATGRRQHDRQPGAGLLKLGDLDKALADYEAALKLNPKLAGSLYGRGVVKQKKGDAAGAEADMAAAKAIRANIADQWANYGVK